MGWFLPKLLKLGYPERIALMFGLGMNNNGTGLVLASMALKDHPLVMLPIIFYNLGQQVIAGIFNTLAYRRLKKDKV
jgi:BASS family bile acid:Na+ symporter